jgi:sec-independent protein translocase protein TatC
MAEEKRLTYLGHLREFRTRLIRSVFAFVIALPFAYFLTYKAFDVLTRITPNVQLIYTEMTENLGVFIKVTLILAFALSLPYIVYQAILYVSPALTKTEKKYVYVLLPSIFVLFVAGSVFSYFVLLPPGLHFLLTFNAEVARPMIKIGNYVSLVTGLIFAMGLVFEIPLIIFFLAKIGIVKTELLTKYRKHAIIVSFILGAIITPTFDPVNQSLVAVPIIVLFELGILLSRFARKKKVSTAVSSGIS